VKSHFSLPTFYFPLFTFHQPLSGLFLFKR
jgi:hypothetical protein